MVNSRRKGKDLENECCRVFRSCGLEAARNLDQYRESSGRDLVVRRLCGCVQFDRDGQPASATLMCPACNHAGWVEAPLCVQVKAGKQPRPLAAYAEAVESAREGEIPMAAIREDRGRWVAVIALEDLLPALKRMWEEEG